MTNHLANKLILPLLQGVEVTILPGFANDHIPSQIDQPFDFASDFLPFVLSSRYSRAETAEHTEDSAIILTPDIGGYTNYFARLLAWKDSMKNSNVGQREINSYLWFLKEYYLRFMSRKQFEYFKSALSNCGIVEASWSILNQLRLLPDQILADIFPSSLLREAKMPIHSPKAGNLEEMRQREVAILGKLYYYLDNLSLQVMNEVEENLDFLLVLYFRIRRPKYKTIHLKKDDLLSTRMNIYEGKMHLLFSKTAPLEFDKFETEFRKLLEELSKDILIGE